MLSDKIRICDICADEIPVGTTYRKSTMLPEAAELFAATEDPDVRPTWTINPDGAVTLDICPTCVLSVGKPPEREQMN